MKELIFHFLYKARWIMALVLFGLAITFLGEGCLINRFEQKKEIIRLKAEIDDYSRQFENDKAELNRLKSDPEAIRRVARERYFMKADNEDIFIVEE